MNKKLFCITFSVIFGLLTKPLFSQHLGLPGNENFNAQSYSISLNHINFEEKTIDAVSQMTCLSLIDDPQEIQLDFISLSVDRVIIANSEADYYQTDSSLVITLPSGIKSGDIFTITTAYRGHPFSEDWGGVVFNGNYVYNLGVGINTIPHNLARSWFPCIDSFTDRATFDYIVTVPDDMKAVCGGLLVEVVDNNDGTDTYHWKSDIELVPYSASFAVGNYEVVEDNYFSKLDGNRNIPVTYYVKPADTAKIAVMFQNLHTIMDLYESKFGPYRFERIGFTSTSLGAMEHQNNIFLPHSTITANLQYEDLYAHELFHSWFGNLVTCYSAEDMWINEGWATFMQSYYKEILYSHDDFLKDKDAMCVSVLNRAHLAAEDGGYYALNKIPETNTYGVSAYERGALVVNALRTYLTDEVFFPAVTEMLNNNEFSSMTSYQLCTELSNTTGINLEGFFHNFVYQPGASTYIIDSCLVEPYDGNKYSAKVYVQQKLNNRAEYTNSNRVDVVFMDSLMNTSEHRVYFDGRYGNDVFTLDFKPQAVFIDYYRNSFEAKFVGEKMLKKTGQTNFSNTNFKIYVESISDSVYCHVTHNLVAPNDDKYVEGYRLSTSHHWKLDFIGPGEYNAKGLFNYSKSNLDKDLLDGSNEVVLMYRSNPSDPWILLETEKTGSNIVGDLILGSVRSGEYTFAIEDSTHYGIIKKKHSCFNIFPNPTSGCFIFQFEDNVINGEMRIFDQNGKLQDVLFITDNRSNISWRPKNENVSSVYFFNFINSDGIVYKRKGILIGK